MYFIDLKSTKAWFTQFTQRNMFLGFLLHKLVTVDLLDSSATGWSDKTSEKWAVTRSMGEKDIACGKSIPVFTSRWWNDFMDALCEFTV